MAHGMSSSIGVGISADCGDASDGGVSFDPGGVDFGHDYCGGLGEHGGHHHGTVGEEALVVSFVAGELSGHDNGHNAFTDSSQGGFGLHGNVDVSVTGGNNFESSDASRQDFGLLVLGHGNVDIGKVVAEACASLGLVERREELGAQKKVKRTHQELLPVKGKCGVMEPPRGIYEGATGCTYAYRSFFSVGSRSPMAFVMRKPLEIASGITAKVRVSVLTWFFAETMDYETRIVISVIQPRSRLVQASGGYCISASERDAHWKAGRDLALKLKAVFSEAKPSDYARLQRSKLNAVAA